MSTSPPRPARAALAALAVGVLAAGAGLAGCACDAHAVLTAAGGGEPSAVAELGELGDPRIPSSSSLTDPRLEEAVATLSSLVNTSDPHLRVTALEGLRRVLERRRDLYRTRFPGLLDPLLADADPEVRWRTAWTLGRLEVRSPALRRAVADPDPRVAERALWAVGTTRDEAALRELVAALDRDGPVQARAVWALERIAVTTQPDVAAWRAWGARVVGRREAPATEAPPPATEAPPPATEAPPPATEAPPPATEAPPPATEAPPPAGGPR